MSTESITRTLTTFTQLWAATDTATDVASSLACDEVDALADVLAATGAVHAAGTWLQAHATQDEPGDAHAGTKYDRLRHGLTWITRTHAEHVHLVDGEPEAFSIGHLILQAEDGHAYALTEVCNGPWDDDDREVTAWTVAVWADEIMRAPELTFAVADVDQLIAHAMAWVHSLGQGSDTPVD